MGWAELGWDVGWAALGWVEVCWAGIWAVLGWDMGWAGIWAGLGWAGLDRLDRQGYV